MKKTWIKIKRGLLEPKHRERLGIRVWLYIYILDNADWEAGEIREWRDKDAADELQMPWRTLQQQRQQLETDGYISCLQSGNRQIITIHNWTNPREYSGKIYNPTDMGTENYVPPDMGDTNEGTREGTNEGVRKPRTLPIRSHITDHIEEEIDINGKYSNYEVAFCNKTGIPPLTPSPRKWFDAAEKMHNAGVEPQDIENAIDILRDRDYAIIGLSSVTNTAINEMSKRKGKRRELTQEEIREKYGKYSE